MPLRRRSSSTSADASNATEDRLTAPLLDRRSDAAVDNDDDAPDANASSSLALSPPSPTSSFAALLWQTLVSAPVSAALSLLEPLIPPRWRPLRLSARAEAALSALREDAAAAFDASSPEHESDLRALWGASFPGKESAYPEASRGKSPMWKEVGWQGDDPRTDLRGGGRGALTAALHMSRHRPSLWRRLRDKKGRGEARDWVSPGGLEYPFGAAGVNVAFLVAQVAGLHAHDAASGAAATAAAAAAASGAPRAAAGGSGGPLPARGPPRTAAAKGFAALLAASVPAEEEEEEEQEEEQEEAETPPSSSAAHSLALRLRAWAVFGDVYCAAFEHLDELWCSRRATYLDFPAVMRDTKEALEKVLSSRRARDAREGLRRELAKQRK